MDKRKKILKIIKWTSLSFVLLSLSAILFVLSYLFGIEDWRAFDPVSIKEDISYSLILLDGDGQEYAIISGDERRRYTSIEDIPSHVKNAFLAIEDARFYEHGGIDMIRILGALGEDIKSGGIVQGASTISQQLVKNALLRYDQDVTRKLAEIMMAFKLESIYSKDEILELYMNIVNLGSGAYGVGAAAETYFGKAPAELTLAEGATLAAILKSPTNYSPKTSPVKCRQRRDLVLAQMLEHEFITQEEYAAATATPLRTIEYDASAYPYGYFTDMVQKEASALLSLPYSELQSGGYTIYTTLDRQLQQRAEALAADPANFPENAEDGLPVECAIVAMDSSGGAIRALVGGREHSSRLSLNRATSMRRQPGSAIKPVIVFAPAVEYLGYQPTSFLLDEPQDFAGYAPRNSGNQYSGWITLRDTVARSVNVPAVRLFNELTVKRGKAYASSVGIPFGEKDKNLSLALGGFTTGVTPLELCGAYMPFANNGYYTSPFCISKIVDVDGNIVYENDTASYSVLSEETAYLISSMLESSAEYGTSKNIHIDGVPLAAKTGTSTYDDADNNKDAWIVAYNSDYTFCCWMGFDKTDESHSLPKGTTGGAFPAAIAKAFFSELYPQGNAPQFKMPAGVSAIEIDSQYLSEKYTVCIASPETPEDAVETEFFAKKYAPQELASYPSPVAPDDLSVSPGAGGALDVSFTSQEGLVYTLRRRHAFSGIYDTLATMDGTGGTLHYADTTALPATEYIYEAVASLPETALPSNADREPKTALFLYSAPASD